MPTGLSYHAISNINKMLSIISGGWGGWGLNRQTWFYNHKTQQFSDGPALLQARMFHASATLANKLGMYYVYMLEQKDLSYYYLASIHLIPLVTGGRDYHGRKLDVTEVLGFVNYNWEWKPGRYKCIKNRQDILESVF